MSINVGDVRWPQPAIRLNPYERGTYFEFVFEAYVPANSYDPCTDPVLGAPREFDAGTELVVKTFIENDKEPASTSPADLNIYRATWRVTMLGLIVDLGNGSDPARCRLIADKNSMDRAFLLDGSLLEVRIHVYLVESGRERSWLEFVLPLEEAGL